MTSCGRSDATALEQTAGSSPARPVEPCVPGSIPIGDLDSPSAKAPSVSASVPSLKHERLTRWVARVQRSVWRSVAAVTFTLAWGCHSNPANFPPRVVMTTGRVARVDGPSALEPRRPALLVYTVFKDLEAMRKKAADRGMGDRYQENLDVVTWRGDPLSFADLGETLLVSTPAGPLLRISLKGMPYVFEVHAITAPLDGKGDWLALMIRHRATSHREQILLYDPAGTLVHQELLARPAGFTATLWASGTGDTQQFSINVGDRYHFEVR